MKLFLSILLILFLTSLNLSSEEAQPTDYHVKANVSLDAKTECQINPVKGLFHSIGAIGNKAKLLGSENPNEPTVIHIEAESYAEILESLKTVLGGQIKKIVAVLDKVDGELKKIDMKAEGNACVSERLPDGKLNPLYNVDFNSAVYLSAKKKDAGGTIKYDLDVKKADSGESIFKMCVKAEFKP